MLSKFDRWVTSAPLYSPIEITSSDYDNDRQLWKTAPADETACTRCGEIIGFYLYEDPETSADLPAFRTFWIMDEDEEQLFCEDCLWEVTGEAE